MQGEQPDLGRLGLDADPPVGVALQVFGDSIGATGAEHPLAQLGRQAGQPDLPGRRQHPRFDDPGHRGFQAVELLADPPGPVLRQLPGFQHRRGRGQRRAQRPRGGQPCREQLVVAVDRQRQLEDPGLLGPVPFPVADQFGLTALGLAWLRRPSSRPSPGCRRRRTPRWPRAGAAPSTAPAAPTPPRPQGPARRRAGGRTGCRATGSPPDRGRSAQFRAASRPRSAAHNDNQRSRRKECHPTTRVAAPVNSDSSSPKPWLPSLERMFEVYLSSTCKTSRSSEKCLQIKETFLRRGLVRSTTRVASCPRNLSATRANSSTLHELSDFMPGLIGLSRCRKAALLARWTHARREDR